MVLTLTIKHFIENEDFFLRNVDPFPELPQGQKKCFSSKVTVCQVSFLTCLSSGLEYVSKKRRDMNKRALFVTIRPSRPHELVFNVQNNKF